MLRHLIASAVVGLVATCAPGQGPANPAPANGFVALFNGKDLAGWWGAETEDPRGWMALEPEKLAEKKRASLPDIQAHWSVEGAELVNDGGGLYLTTEKNYADFELTLEYRTVAGADSGIYLRGLPQVQIWDTTEAGGKWSIGADKGSGGLWNNSPGAAGKDPLAKADRPFGEWNRVRVVMVGERVSVWLNGKIVVDHARLENYFDRALPAPRTGPIQLQTHGGEIRWRNINIREIAAEEANAILRRGGVDKPEPTRAGFEKVFNGRDFTGWSGPVENYEVVDGALRCKEHQGGTIFTNAVYDDFAVQFEFLLPPGGNNGLAIRYPGEGDTAYVGMCELQVLDSEAPQYAKLDPRQYHGSVYGQWAAQRGYLREPGVWNFQEVTVVGPRITVELNGTVILDKDTSEITEFMYEPDHFTGRSRTEGHFGFAGHSDPVAFREVWIRRIEH
ncbi:MAG: DUF1080 domain-containing protein [Leptolyngbya sp. PLA3]|nr:MAG: DUF1080 domain-containing protein [Cyanobacteria bacterium CYA]MCE7969807.1 DUF1080 domain-containing protein [Leptolyngbya sp. PL-A3]